MRATYILPALAATLCASPVRAAGPIPVDCDRACLEGLVNQYLSALVSHDPKRLPLSKDLKYTENDQVLEIGDGFWNTVSAIGNYKHYFADPVTEQAAFMGTMKEPVVHLTNGENVEMKGFNRPSSIEVTEAFRIENGKIRRVEMVGSGVTYHLNPAWPGGLSDK